VRTRVLASVLCAAAAAGAQTERKLVDEVVAVVDAHSITLSELSAETRIHLVEQQGAQVASAIPDRGLLAASLRRLVEERVILAEVDRLRLFDLERAEVDAAVARFRQRFPTAEAYTRFLDSIELTPDELAASLSRDLRVARYLDNRLKLAAQVREGELDEAMKAYPGVDRASLRQRLAREKYERLLEGLLADLRRKADVRILDSLEDDGRSLAARPSDGGKAEAR